MKFSFAIRTVPQRQGLFGPLYQRVSDLASSREAVTGVSVSCNPDVTPNENACAALQLAPLDKSDWVIFLEDDAGLIDHFLENVAWWLNRYERPDVHVYPLGCQYAHQFQDGAQMWNYPIDCFYCSVAMVVRASQVPSLISYVRSKEWRQGFDVLTGHWHRTVSTSNYFITPVPCLVEHLGDVSTLAEFRSSKNEVGRFAGFKGYDFSYVG